MSNDPARSRFVRAYVACGYLLGNRGEGLLSGVPATEPATRLCQSLQSEAQPERATTLARELTEVASALLQARVW